MVIKHDIVMDDCVYVIFFQGKMYRNRSRKNAYLEERYAKQVITQESKSLAEHVAKNEGIDWYDLSKERKDKYIQIAKNGFEIRKFVEEK